MLLRLISEPEETEEDNRANDSGPSSGLKEGDEDWGLIHDDPGELEDSRVSPVGVSPGNPRANLRGGGVCDDGPHGEGDGATKVEGSQSNETPIAAVSQVRVGGDEIPELLAPLHESADCED